MRFYQWAEPTLSLGYFQAYADRNRHQMHRQPHAGNRTQSSDQIAIGDLSAWLDGRAALVSIDSVRFWRDATSLSSAKGDCRACRTVLAMYAARFASEFEYEEWAIGWRERVHSAYLLLASMTARGLGDQGREGPPAAGRGQPRRHLPGAGGGRRGHGGGQPLHPQAEAGAVGAVCGVGPSGRLEQPFKAAGRAFEACI